MAMFSILLPTRNRLDLLKRAIQTVLRQDFEDWEIIDYFQGIKLNPRRAIASLVARKP